MIGTVKAIKRLTNSPSGNPRFLLTMEWDDGGSQGLPTPVDAGWAYEITDGWIGKRFDVRHHPSGRYFTMWEQPTTQA